MEEPINFVENLSGGGKNKFLFLPLQSWKVINSTQEIKEMKTMEKSSATKQTKSRWVRPVTVAQSFVPDEYISACWEVACNGDLANEVERKIYGSTTITDTINHNGGCRDAKNQWITYNEHGVATDMEERGAKIGDHLHCTVYGDVSYASTREISTVKAGDYIYWTTSGWIAGKRCAWHHQGSVSHSSNNHS